MNERPAAAPGGKHSAFLIHSSDPLNGGPPLELLVQSELTPHDLFFVRNHGTIPHVEPADYRLLIDGMVERSLALSLEELRRDFACVTVQATLECAGNRRDELIAVEDIPGELPWGAEAIGNA